MGKKDWKSRPTVLGVLVFVASEAVFFALLITAYVYFHREVGVASAARTHLDALRTGMFSILLLASSFTVWRAEIARRTDRTRARRLWLLATVLLGGLFLVGQVTEYAGLLDAGVTIGTSLFGSAFFTLTGLHGIHVLVGLVAIGIVLSLDLVRAKTHSVTQQSVSVYWHFVDGVWVVIFTIVYLLPLRGV